MPSSLADYLAKNYLTADPGTERPKKKRKKAKQQAEDPGAGGGLIIADDDPPDLRTARVTGNKDEDEDAPVVTGTGSAEFRRAKKSGWKTIGGAPTTTATATGAEADAADAILASAAAERNANKDPDDDEDEPMIEAADNNEGAPRMESGALAGLQTAEQTAAMVATQERQRKAEAAKYKNKPGGSDEAQETIYRDASGRIINVAMKRAEARRAEEQKAEKEEAARDALIGDVQRQERETRREQLQEARTMPLARTAEDEAMNDEMKDQQRWNDPAAEFLTRPTGGGAGGVSRTGKPLYKGGFQPNRYGIRPGHRWDGVDRGTGFEKEWFAARNRKGRMENLEYEWQMDE